MSEGERNLQSLIGALDQNTYLVLSEDLENDDEKLPRYIYEVHPAIQGPPHRAFVRFRLGLSIERATFHFDALGKDDVENFIYALYLDGPDIIKSITIYNEETRKGLYIHFLSRLGH